MQAALEETQVRTGYFTATYHSSVDDSEQPFALWVPPDYKPSRRYPLVVLLHGTDADHTMIPEECFRIHERGFRNDVLLLSPFGRGDLFYEAMGEADVWDAIRWVRERYSVDARRQYLSGLSMGGFATWKLGCRYPEQWAALAPICGGGALETLTALKNIPVWCVHGQKDTVVAPSHSRRLIAALAGFHHRFRYDELPGCGHASWRWVYDPDRTVDTLVDWFLQFRKRAAAPLRLAPKRTGAFKDLFLERVIVSCPHQAPIPREAHLLRTEAERLAQFTFGDQIMRRGRLIVRTDAELTAAELTGANHLMLGRTDNHLWLKKKERRLLTRHFRGQLQVAGETYLGKSLIAATVQPSPWNRDRLLGIITYQQCQQLRGIAEKLCGPDHTPLAVNLYDTQQRRFIRQETSPRP